MTATSQELWSQIARLARNAYESPAMHPNWEDAAADATLRLPGLQTAFAAVERISAELQRHVGESWGADSDTTTCAACRSAWPCQTFTTLSGDNS